MKKRLISLTLAGSMLLSLAACGGGGSSTAGSTSTAAPAESSATAATAAEPVAGGDLTLGMATDATEAAAWRMRSGQEKFVFASCYETLMDIDDDGNIVGNLAESLTADEDDLSYTVKLRQDVTFSDGSALDADVLMWNFENFKENSQTSSTHFGSVDHFEKLDDYSVKICLSEWNTQIPYSLNSVAGLMYSKKAFDDNGYDWCLENPVGTGPYVMTEWVRDDHVTFKKNENYWNKAEVEPALDTLTFKVIADEMSAQAALTAGDIDGYYGASESLQTALESAGFTRATNKMWYTILFLIFASDVQDSPLADVRVRQAISYAIDSDTIAKTIGYGKVFVSNQYAVEGTMFYNPDVKGYGYDVDQAKALLADAGYADGFTTTIYCGVDQALTDYLVAIQGYLKAVGITLNIDEMETAEWRSTGIYDIPEGMILAGHGFGANLVNQQVSNFSKRAISGVGMLKECKLHPDDLDECIMKSLSASGTEEMLKYEFQTEKMIIDDYCLGYPVGLKASQVYMIAKDVNGAGFETMNEYVDYTKISFQ